MKGRLTSLNVNVVIDGINVALENKYDILQKSRNALKKKDLDMYNTWKIQQKVVGQGNKFKQIAKTMNILIILIFRSVFYNSK